MNDLFARAPVGWRDALDIAIVTVLIYEVLKLIRGTRAAQMVVGAGLIAGLLVLSHVAHLETVNWLIRNMVGYIVFAAIVLFQSDIRRALAHFGRAPFFRLLSKGRAAEEVIEETAVAAGMLSKARVGAIIAIEREIGLRNYIEGGIPLDAKVSYDLLVTIFQTESHLHDGAAIGLTEENDSVAVVVSEETGMISLVLDGDIERGLTPDDLRRRLRRLVLFRREGTRAQRWFSFG